jgi:similar to spore coat protein
MTYAKHEVLELLEIVNFRTTGLAKSGTMHRLAADNELQSLMQRDAELAARHLEELCPLLEQATHEEEKK